MKGVRQAMQTCQDPGSLTRVLGREEEEVDAPVA
jgi:hypothetical protein